MEEQLTFLNKRTNHTKQKRKAMPSIITIFVDGASRNNPGPAGAGVYITRDSKPICKQGYYLGEKTNNQAEYLAVLLALFLVEQEFSKEKIENPHLIITSDSELIVKQMTGKYRVKNQFIAKIKIIIDKLLLDKSYTFKHVLREKNKTADKLANQGIDTKKKLPPAFVTLLTDHEIDL